MKEFIKKFFIKKKVEKDGENWIKRYRSKNYANLSKKQAMELEIECLERLNKNFFCVCGVCGETYSHFPILKSIDWDKKEIVISDKGETIKSLRETFTRKDMLDVIPALGTQINCINCNLNVNDIAHLDIHRNNLCVKNGIISLIDFDIAVLDDNPKNDYLASRRQPTTEFIKRMILT